MKIGIARRTFRVDGGAERAVNCYVDGCLSNGFSVQLAASEWMGGNHRLVEHVHIPMRGIFRSSKSKSFRKGVYSWVQNGDCDLYQSNEWANGVDILRLGDGLHSVWLDVLDSEDSYIASLMRRTSNFHRDRLESEREALDDSRLKTVICNSRFIERQVLDRYPWLANKTTVLYNPAPSSGNQIHGRSITTPLDQPINLGFAGSGWYRKGLDRLLATMRLLPPSVNLFVAGRDSKERHYVEQVNRLGLAERVRFLGVRNDMVEFYSNIQLLVSPVRYEPFPNTVIEALVNSVPVISSFQSGASDFNNDSGVFLCRPEPESIAEMIQKVLDMGPWSPPQALLDNFSFENFSSRLAQIYKRYK